MSSSASTSTPGDTAARTDRISSTPASGTTERPTTQPPTIEPPTTEPPTEPPTTGPATEPTTEPTNEPTNEPTTEPTNQPTTEPTARSTKTTWKLPNPKPGRPKSEFGDIKAEPGQGYGISYAGAGGASAGEVIFVVSKVSLAPKCAPQTPQPANGRFLEIDITVEPRNVAENVAKDWTGSFSAQGWTAYDSAGQAQPGTNSDQAQACAGDRRVPSVTPELLQRGALFGGVVILDVKSAKGTVVLDLGGTSGGWEFRYG